MNTAVYKAIERMTLEEKVGQLFAIGFHSDQVDDHVTKLITEHHAGNIILFRRNFTTRRCMVEMNEHIQALMMEHNGVPAWISADQEGGMVSRLTAPYAQYPGGMACSAGATLADMRRIGKSMGEELRDAGINMNLAPVLDVNNNARNPVIGVRSYGDDPERVAAYGVAMFEGLCEAGIVPVGKHFPGHGDTAQDSHLTLPTVPHSREHAEAVELYPFQAAVRSGIPALMTTHILFPGLDDSGLPATLSTPILTGYLRGELGFEGLIVTDCMQMKAIADLYGTPEGCVAAIRAGANMVFVSHDRDVQIASIRAVIEAVYSGELDEALIHERVRRTLAIKAARLSPRQAMTDAALAEHCAYADSLSARCVTLVHDRMDLLPLEGKRVFSISPAYAHLTGADDPGEATSFARACAQRFGGEVCTIDARQPPDETTMERLRAGCATADVVVLGTYSAVLFKAQAKALEWILAQGKPVVLCALRLPYDVALSPRVGASLCTYDYTPAMVSALLDVLAGAKPAQGRLPISVAVD